MIKENLIKENLISLLTKHKNELTTVRAWDRYAKEHSLPSSTVIIESFDSWNQMKKELGIKQTRKRYNDNELLRIAEEQKEHFTTIEHWDEYAEEHGFPHYRTYLNHFKTWNNLKELLGLPKLVGSPKQYDKEIIKTIILENKDHFKSKSSWEKYAKDFGFPTYNTLTSFYSWSEIQNMAGFDQHGYNKEKLIEIAKTHHEHFTSFNKWNIYASENGLPSAITYSRAFGSWKIAKEAIFKGRF